MRALSSLLVVLALTLLASSEAAKHGGGKGSKSASSQGGSASGGSKSKAALPRSKKAKGGSKGGGDSRRGGGGVLSRSVGGGLVYRMFREMKTAFGSELEALTLTLTRPSEAAIPEASIDELVQVFEGEYENPQFTVGLLAKLSRKLGEPNVYTKLKALLCVHRLMEHASDESQSVLLQCVRSLRSEVDEKLGAAFFAAESVETARDAASNVGEAEASQVASEYVNYVFDYLDCKGETPRKVTSEHASPDRLEIVLSLIEHGLEVEDQCKAAGGTASASKGGVLRQCSECCKRNRAWLLKQASRLYELKAFTGDASIKKEVEAVLSEFNVKFTKLDDEAAPPSKEKKIPEIIKGATSLEAEEAPPTAEQVSTPLKRARGAEDNSNAKASAGKGENAAAADDEDEDEEEEQEEQEEQEEKGNGKGKGGDEGREEDDDDEEKVSVKKSKKPEAARRPTAAAAAASAATTGKVSSKSKQPAKANTKNKRSSYSEEDDSGDDSCEDESDTE